MPPRLMHKKSRMGCKRCKVRKVKCDEERPICGACKRHNLECVYLEPTPPAPRREPSVSAQSSRHSIQSVNSINSPGLSDSPTPAPSSSAGAPEPDDGMYPATEERRKLELRLMHRYMQCFSEIFAGIHSETIAQIWRDQVPAMAIHHPFLLHALYAVTTLHATVTKKRADQDASIGRREPIAVPGVVVSNVIPSAPPILDELDLDEMKKAHQLYFSLAVRGQRMAVASLNHDNADAVCMATILISNQGFLLDYDLDTSESAYEPPVQWMLLASSINTVMRACHGMLGPKSALVRIVNSGRSILLDQFNIPPNAVYFRPLMDFQADTELVDHQAYQDAVCYLGAIRYSTLSSESIAYLARRFFSFATFVHAGYIGLVRQNRARALVILACFFAMSKEIEGIWWFRGVAIRHVRGIRTLVPSEWGWALDWAEDMAKGSPATRHLVLDRETMCTPASG